MVNIYSPSTEKIDAGHIVKRYIKSLMFSMTYREGALSVSLMTISARARACSGVRASA